MDLSLDPIPYNDPPIEGGTAPVSKGWFRWLEDLVARVAAGAHLIDAVALTGQAASLAPTSLGVLTAGIYQVSYVLRITQAATTSSSLIVSVNYLDDGVAVTQSGPAVTGNTTTTVQSGVITVESDGASPVTLSTTYASVGATAMHYKLSVQTVRVT